VQVVEGGCVVARQAHLIAVVGTFLIGCVLLLVVGCAGTSSETSKKEQTRSPEATASEEARCDRTRTIRVKTWLVNGPGFGPGIAPYITNDVPGCRKGGLLTGTNKRDYFAGKDGPDEIRGLGGSDYVEGGLGGDFIYGGPGDDELEGAGRDFENGHGHYFRFSPKDLSKNVLHGGPGDDLIEGGSAHDRIVGGKGSDAIGFSPGSEIVHGGPGEDKVYGYKGEDVLYGEDGNDYLFASRPKGGGRDELYCGEGKDKYEASPNDYVDSSCEEKKVPKKHPHKGRIEPAGTSSASASTSSVPLGGTGGPALLPRTPVNRGHEEGAELCRMLHATFGECDLSL
jgi:hypothetical protein